MLCYGCGELGHYSCDFHICGLIDTQALSVPPIRKFYPQVEVVFIVVWVDQKVYVEIFRLVGQEISQEGNQLAFMVVVSGGW